ncbi:MAG: hypothetical protein AAGC65_11645 [Mucilaginibacter sp.]|uniref:hypothetical protein n=1 Tax=Mucilaginibacter sp. TaxID=1882438 RepID=UPI00319F685B
MNTTRFYQSMYVNFYRWSFKNFGQTGLPKFNSLFGVNFLMIILLTILMLATEFFLKSGWFNVSPISGTFIQLAVVAALLLNYFTLLNNKRFNKINIAFERLSKNNKKMWSVMVLGWVIASCGFLLMTTTIR